MTYTPAHTNTPAIGKSLYSEPAAGRGKSYPCKPLHAIMEELGHSQVDVLKFDIEGAEWDVLKLTDWAALRIGQILVELHDFEHAHPCASILRDVFHPLEAAGFYQFALEPVCSTQCSGQYEVAFVPSLGLASLRADGV
jgi:hypothetical protein